MTLSSAFRPKGSCGGIRNWKSSFWTLRNAKSNVWRRNSVNIAPVKKRHAMKIQIIADKKTRNILCVFFGTGRTHDFQLYKNSKTRMSDKIESVEDKGFQGLQKLHANSTIPVKASKNHKLTKEEKKLNREISKRRIEIEHINRYIKRFHILSYRYRNKRKRFALRASLICGIIQLSTRLLTGFRTGLFFPMYMGNTRRSFTF